MDDMLDINQSKPEEGASPSSGKSPLLEGALHEYDALHRFSLEIYRLYARTLVFVGIAAGAIAALLINNVDKLTVDRVGVMAIALTLFINTWAAGWAYLNLELWSHRAYLQKLEEFIRSELKVDRPVAPFNFYSSQLFGMYGKGPSPSSRKGSGRYYSILNICFASAILVIYLGTLYLAYQFGFSAVAKKYLTAFGKWKWTFENIGPVVFVFISLGLLICTAGSKAAIQRNQELLILDNRQ